MSVTSNFSLDNISILIDSFEGCILILSLTVFIPLCHRPVITVLVGQRNSIPLLSFMDADLGVHWVLYKTC